MTRRDRLFFFSLAACAWAYVIARAVLVPPVNDEVRAFHMFVLTGDFVPFVASWDAANHVLLSALAQSSYFLFGEGMAGLRIWSVLAFALYAWYAWRMGAWIGSSLVRWCMWAALLYTPFQIEFFSMYRGYGLGLGFLLMAVFHSVQFAQEERRGDLLRALCAMALAAYAMLSLLVLWCGALALLMFVAWRGRSTARRTGRLLWCLFLGMVPLVVLALFARGLADHGALYFGSSEGLYQGTYRSLCKFILGKEQAGWMIAVLVALILGALPWLRWPRRTDRSEKEVAQVMITVLLVASLSGQELLGTITGVLYPVDRAALYLVPLAVLLFTLGIDAWTGGGAFARFAALPLLFFPLRAAQLANFTHTMYWPDQSIPDRFFALVADRQRQAERTLVVGGHIFQAEVWSYCNRRNGYGLNELDASERPSTAADLVLLDTTMYPIPAEFRLLATGPEGRINLLERIEPMRTRSVVDSTFSQAMSNDEFTFLWDEDATRWHGRSFIVEVDADITSKHGLTEAILSVSVLDARGDHVFERSLEVDRQRGSTLRGPLHLSRFVPVVPDSAARIAMVYYNPRWRGFALNGVRVRVREIVP